MVWTSRVGWCRWILVAGNHVYTIRMNLTLYVPLHLLAEWQRCVYITLHNVVKWSDQSKLPKSSVLTKTRIPTPMGWWNSRYKQDPMGRPQDPWWDMESHTMTRAFLMHTPRKPHPLSLKVNHTISPWLDVVNHCNSWLIKSLKAKFRGHTYALSN